VLNSLYIYIYIMTPLLYHVVSCQCFVLNVQKYLFFFCPLVQDISGKIEMFRDLGEFEFTFNGVIVSKVFRRTYLIVDVSCGDYPRVAPGQAGVQMKT